MTEKIRFCPNCGATEVEPDRSHTNQLGEIISNPDKWVCKECDYRGLMPEEDPEDLDKSAKNLEFEPEHQEKLDTDLGRGEFNFFLYFTAPLIIILLLIVIAGYLI